MSVRAYRVISLDVAKDPSFNLWQNQELAEDVSVYEGLGESGDGFSYVSCDIAEKVLNDKDRGFEIEEYIEKTLRADIKAVRKGGDEYILYSCF